MAIAGKVGKIAIGISEPVKIVGIKNWALELSMDALETTELGNDWKSYLAGLKEWTASSEGDYSVITDKTGQEELQNAFIDGSEVDVNLYVDGTHYYKGKAIITSLSIEDPVDDLVSISIEFTGCGAISFS